MIFKDDKSAGIINFVLPFYLFSSTDESSSDEEKTTEKESAKDPQYDNPSQKDDSYRTGDYDDSQSRKDDSLSRTDNAHNDDDVTRTGRSYTIKEGSRDEEFTQVTKISATADVKNMSKVSMFRIVLLKVCVWKCLEHMETICAIWLFHMLFWWLFILIFPLCW